MSESLGQKWHPVSHAAPFQHNPLTPVSFLSLNSCQPGVWKKKRRPRAIIVPLSRRGKYSKWCAIPPSPCTLTICPSFETILNTISLPNFMRLFVPVWVETTLNTISSPSFMRYSKAGQWRDRFRLLLFACWRVVQHKQDC